MVAWWNSLTLLQQIFAAVAIPATAVLVLQTVLLLFGVGDDGSDADADVDAGGDSADGLSLFTIRGIVTFFAIGGWLGLALSYTGLHEALVLLIAFVAGALGLVLTAVAMKAMLKLQYNGTLKPENAVGAVATAYIPIPAGGAGAGKVTVTVQERLTELDAITTADRTIQTGERVRVTGCIEQNTLIVEPINANKEEL